ncbi:MAG: PAS domain S-box protein, partial [Bacteroidota bacterium]|nr:PAS domain S-box protein [Bacteroidota bacterium]
MNKKLKILYLEDVQIDAELISRVLKKGNIDCEYLVVDAKEAYIIALQEFKPDVILSDHTLPSFDSHEALAILQDTGLNIPFILVTATVSEEFAVDVIKRGAEDYILKDRPDRLPSAIRNALEKFSRKKEREQMIYDQSHLAAVVNSSNDSIISEKLNGTITSWNPRAEKLFNYSAAQAIGNSISLIIPPGRLHEELEFIEKIKKGEHVQDFETVRLARNGKALDVSLTISPLNDNNGKIIGAVKIVHDITERKKVERQLADSEQFNKGILASLSAHIAVIDDNGTIIAVNKAWDDFAKENDVSSLSLASKGANYFDVCKKAEEDGDTVAEQALSGIQSVFKKEKETFELEYPCDAPDQQRWFTLRVMNFGGDGSKVVISHQNITARKLAEEKTIHANRLYGFISHINQTIVHVKDQQALFNEACRIAVEQGKFKMALIGIADTATGKLQLSASYGLAESDIKRIGNFTYIPGGPIEKILQGLDCYVINDLLNNTTPGVAEYAAERGLRSAIFLAIKRGGKVTGVFNIYSTEMNFFNPQEIALFKEATADISFALDVFEKEKLKKEAERALKESKRVLKELAGFNQKLIDVSPMGIATYDAISGECVSANIAFAKIVGATSEDVLKKNFRHLESWRTSGLLKDAEATLLDGKIHYNEISITTSFGKEVW